MFVGFAFTEWPIHNLQERGFQFHKDQRGLEQGYGSFTAVLPDLSSFQIRQVHNEESYTAFHHNEHFAPLILEEDFSLNPLKQDNSVLGIRGFLNSSQMKPCELRTYLEVRKPFPISALWLKCLDIELFQQRARPDRVFQFEGQKAALIHLGPNCFDLLISQDT